MFKSGSTEKHRKRKSEEIVIWQLKHFLRPVAMMTLTIFIASVNESKLLKNRFVIR
jgi:hypothetical protein